MINTLDLWKRVVPAVGLLTVLVLVLFGMSLRPAAAAGIVVNTAADNTTTGDNFCTLREAINNANSDSDTTGGDCAAGSGADTITFDGDYTITLAGSSLPAVTTGMTITGNGAANTIIQASACNPVTLPGGCTPADYRVFEVTATGNLTLNSVTVRHGGSEPSPSTAAVVGGGILNAGGTLTVTDSTLSGNAADLGGGIRNASGTLTVTNSTFSGNSAAFGGGIYNYEGEAIVANSTLSDNSAAGGGGIYIFSGEVTVTSSTLSDNSAAGYAAGGGIRNEGMLTVTNSTLSGNSAGSGGGIGNFGTLTVTNTTLSGNSADFGDGGGIRNYRGEVRGEVTVTGSTLSGNTAGSFGGGISNYRGEVSVTNSTLSGNSADDFGGGIRNASGTLIVTNSTLSGNSATNQGGGIFNTGSGTATLTRSLISGNSAAVGDEIFRDTGTMTANAFNVFGHSDLSLSNSDAFVNFVPGASDVTATSDEQNVALANILSTTLAENGGPTQTHALVPGSPAIDLAPSTACAAAPVNGLDQRGEPRNVNGDGIATASECDTGAFEYQSATATPTPSITRTPILSDWSYMPLVQGVAVGPTVTPTLPPPTMTASPALTSQPPTATATATQTLAPSTTPTSTTTATTTPTATPTSTLTPDPGNSLLQNGNFEQGPTGWSESSTNGYDLIVNDFGANDLDAHSGTWAAWLGGDNNEQSIISQQVTITAGKPILSYYFLIGSADACSFDFGGVAINQNAVDTLDLCASTSTEDWVERNVDLSSFVGQTVALAFWAETDDSQSSNLFIDDVGFQSSRSSNNMVPVHQEGVRYSYPRSGR